LGAKEESPERLQDFSENNDSPLRKGRVSSRQSTGKGFRSGQFANEVIKEEPGENDGF